MFYVIHEETKEEYKVYAVSSALKEEERCFFCISKTTGSGHPPILFLHPLLGKG